MNDDYVSKIFPARLPSFPMSGKKYATILKPNRTAPRASKRAPHEIARRHAGVLRPNPKVPRA
jgi:hypothetical protein